MNSLLNLRNTCDALLVSGEYDNIELIGSIDWKKMPESAKEVKSIVIGNTRITEYVQGTIRIVSVHPYGLFQII